MRDKRKPGQLNGGEKGAAAKLSSWLPGCGLHRLTDEEATRIINILNFVDRIAASEGFSYGWRAAQEYNDDVERLRSMPQTLTQH